MRTLYKGLMINWSLHELLGGPDLLPPVCLFISEHDAKKEQLQVEGIDYMALYINPASETCNGIAAKPGDITVYAISYALRQSRIPALSIPLRTPPEELFISALKTMHQEYQQAMIESQKATDLEIPLIDEKTEPPPAPTF